MELFIHAGKDTPLKRIEVDGQTQVGDLVTEHGSAEGALWLEGADAPLAENATLEAAGVPDGARVYAGRCKKIEATVTFSDEPAETHEVSPSSTVGSLLEWAVGPKGFDLPADERKKHTLAVCDTEEQAEKSAHVGEFGE